MLNVGGAKVRPEEVEEVLFSLPEIADARVYGARNPITGVVLAADIVAQPGQDITSLKATLPANLRARLEAYKVPRIFNFVSSLVVSEAGKKKKLG
jgi:acyl-coenzyme A synthetase/AMP-(fatty) acid ligase